MPAADSKERSMDTSMGIPDLNPVTLPATRSQRPEAAFAAIAQPAAASGTQVSISAEARAAEAAARLAAPDQAGEAPALPQGGAQSTNPVQATAPGELPAAVTSASSAPVETAQAAIAERSAAGPVPREPDAASADRNVAVQLYLENAVRPDNQPSPSAFRESA